MPRGRAPPGPPGSSICRDSRAALARILSDHPPEAQGYGAQVSPQNRHDDELLSIFPHTDTTQLLRGRSRAESDARSIQIAVKRGPDAAAEHMASLLQRTAARAGRRWRRAGRRRWR